MAAADMIYTRGGAADDRGGSMVRCYLSVNPRSCYQRIDSRAL